MTIQDLRSKRGEIEFRRRLYQQQVDGEQIFDDEFDAEGIEAVLLGRMAETHRTMHGLRDQGVLLSPYLEIGAERGQRALVMENDLGASGAALDLSLDLLRSCEHYAGRFGRPRLPLRLCADAYALPFRTGSLPFVFCYQTLHHFPALEPIVAEIHRVLAPGGHFFFAEEPYRRVLRWRLIRAKGGVRNRRVGRMRKLLRALFVEEEFNEDGFGVLENHDTPIAAWKSALGIFASGTATLTLDRFSVDAYRPRNPLVHGALYLLGGRIGGLYRKAGELRDHARTIDEALISPVALVAGGETTLGRDVDGYLDEAGTRYTTEDGVAMLLTPAMRAQLYPELAGR